MSIEKMELVNIAGFTKELDSVLVQLSNCGYFHIESASKMANKKNGVSTLNEDNPFITPLKHLNDISTQINRKFKNEDYSDIKELNTKKIQKYIF